MLCDYFLRTRITRIIWWVTGSLSSSDSRSLWAARLYRQTLLVHWQTAPFTRQTRVRDARFAARFLAFRRRAHCYFQTTSHFPLLSLRSATRTLSPSLQGRLLGFIAAGVAIPIPSSRWFVVIECLVWSLSRSIVDQKWTLFVSRWSPFLAVLLYPDSRLQSQRVSSPLFIA